MHPESLQKFALMGCAIFRMAWLALAIVLGSPRLAAQDAWTAAAATGTTNNLFAVTYGNEMFVAVGNGGTIVTSPDGDIWTARSSGTPIFLADIAFGNGVFVAVGIEFIDDGFSGTLLRSSDGVNWTYIDAGTALHGTFKVTFGNGIFVVPNDAASVLTSPDGVTWTAQSWPAQADVRLMAYGNGRFVGLEQGTEIQRVLTSTDGQTWTRTQFSTEAVSGMRELIFAMGKFMAFGEGVTGGAAFRDGKIFISADGLTWADPPIALPDGYVTTAIEGDGVIVAAGPNGDLFTSADGQLWILRAPAPGQPFNDVAYGNGRFVLVGNSGAIASHGPSFPAPSVVSLKTPSISVDETAGSVAIVLQRTGNLTEQITVPLHLPGMFPVTFAAGESEASFAFQLFYEPARTNEAEGRFVTSVRLGSGFDYVLSDPTAGSVAVLDHEAPIRFAELRALGASLNADTTGNFSGEIRLQNISTESSGSLRVKLTAVPVGIGDFPAGFNSDPRTLGVTTAIAPLASNGELWLSFAGITPPQLGVVYWDIFASLEELAGNDWLLVDRWRLFDWGRPLNFARPQPTSLPSFGRSAPAATGGATVTTSPILAPLLTVGELAIVGPPVVTSGVTPKYSLVVKLSDGTLSTLAPEWTTTFGTINSAGRLTTPIVGESTGATITGAVTFNGARRAVNKDVRIEPPRAPVITSPGIAFATTGLAFRYRITALNGPTSFGAMGVAAGFSVNTATGLITGIPTQTGTFQVTIFASNAGGVNERMLELRVFDPSPLVVTQEGSGTLSAPFPGTEFRSVGSVYTITAKPAPGWLFDGWSGALTSAAPKLVFTMTEGLSIEATFIENPFPATKGTYAGLVIVFPPSHSASGFFIATTTVTGRFTGRLIFGGVAHPVSGRFDNDGLATLKVRRKAKPSLAVQLKLDVDTAGANGISGSVFDGQERPVIAAARAIVLPDEFAAVHTARISVQAGPGLPQAEGFGVITRTRNDQLAFAGMLPDGAKASFAAPLTTGSTWPFYGSLYRGRGSVAGPVKVREQVSVSDLDGALRWFKPAGSTRVHPDGWPGGITATLLASKYDAGTSPTSARFLPGLADPSGTGNLSIAFAAGNLPGDVITDVNLFPSGKVQAVTSAQKFKCELQAARGLFRGTFTPADGARRRSFQGVFYQKQSVGTGLHLGDNSAGSVMMSPK